jgi:secreted trypsin-like serine protease
MKGHETQIAYGSNCQVADVPNLEIKANLESMAVALTDSSGRRYCTGTPLSYDSSTGTGYVLSAAHCVVGNSKTANQPVSANNIVTFEFNRNYINQTLDASSWSGTTGTVQAVYIPKQYCQSAAFVWRNGSYQCGDLAEQNGDLALLKVSFAPGKVLNINPQVQLANLDINPKSPSYIMALGYGITNTDSSNSNLFHITYENFATNAYKDTVGKSVIMNGYSPAGYNAYYSVICSGDSGGGDFYWSNNTWNLIGVHSYGASLCGQGSSSYGGASDISADVRPFATQLRQIMASDNTSKGCDDLAAGANNFICANN